MWFKLSRGKEFSSESTVTSSVTAGTMPSVTKAIHHRKTKANSSATINSFGDMDSDITITTTTTTAAATATATAAGVEARKRELNRLIFLKRMSTTKPPYTSLLDDGGYLPG
ncbi:hypothetical protein BGX31_005603 [Mortierella sp. GBA43]|nr:hypothetical protein BGX31_005603 [Mortierella sp. GBA43]